MMFMKYGNLFSLEFLQAECIRRSLSRGHVRYMELKNEDIIWSLPIGALGKTMNNFVIDKKAN